MPHSVCLRTQSLRFSCRHPSAHPALPDSKILISARLLWLAGSINVQTDTPVNVRSPVQVDTPSKRVEWNKGKGWGNNPDTVIAALNALAGYGNFLANSANAGGSITTAGVCAALQELLVCMFLCTAADSFDDKMAQQATVRRVGITAVRCTQFQTHNGSLCPRCASLSFSAMQLVRSSTPSCPTALPMTPTHHQSLAAS